MDVKGTSFGTSQKISAAITTALASAFLEWLLILMLFIDAIFSYLVKKFASYCNLKIPCLLCSRLDHVFGNEKSGFYWDLICGNHKLEISSLVFCHAHHKLVDVYETCESCLFSFATINKSNAETYRLLVGKLGAGPDPGPDQDPLLADHSLGSSSTRKNCLCCHEQSILRSSAQKLFQTRSIGSEAGELDAPLSVTIGHNWDGQKKISDESCVLTRASQLEKGRFDPLSHIEYTKVKINSDTESEVHFSDDDNVSAVIRETKGPKEDFALQCVLPEPCIITQADDLTSEKLIHPDSASVPLLQESEEVVDIHATVASTATGHGLEEVNWRQVENKADVSVTSKLISFDEVPPSCNRFKTPVEVLGETLEAPGKGEFDTKNVTEGGDICKAGSRPASLSETRSELSPVTSETGSLMRNYLDLGDVYKLATSTRERQLSGMLSEQRPLKDSTQVSEDLKLLLSQMSFGRGIELSLNDKSPRVSGNSDELKFSDASSSIGMQILQKRISLERNESGLSLDGSTFCEIEGESMVDRLKRQVEHDNKLMGAMYKELEEERNASAVAANQAMAMITKLQEEKATLHMEASQCIRMMEEQAEYDVEALQKANDDLREKEKEIQDLEAELELYRNRFGDISVLENIVEPNCDLNGRDGIPEYPDASCAESGASVPCNSVSDKPDICDKNGTIILFGVTNGNTALNSLLEFEDERLYILQYLKKLEKQLHLFASSGICLDMVDGQDSVEQGDRVWNLKELNCRGGSHENGVTEENSLQKDIFISEGSPHAEEGCVSSCGNLQLAGKESSEQISMICGETDLVSLRNEFSNLGSRLEALEADCNFLKHSIGSLRNGDEGLKFIQDIVSHLCELRRIGIRRRDESLA